MQLLLDPRGRNVFTAQLQRNTNVRVEVKETKETICFT